MDGAERPYERRAPAAHAALLRPGRAQPPRRRRAGDSSGGFEDDDDDDDDSDDDYDDELLDTPSFSAAAATRAQRGAVEVGARYAEQLVRLDTLGSW